MKNQNRQVSRSRGVVAFGQPFFSWLLKGLPVLLGVVLLSGSARAQTFPSTSKCISKDLDLIESIMRGQSENSLLPGNRKMVLTVNNKTTSDRRAYVLWGTMKRYDINGTLKTTQRVSFCVDSVKKSTTLSLFARDSIYYGQDESIVVSGIYTGWSTSTGSETCEYLTANTSKISPSCQYRDSVKIYTGVNARFGLTKAVCDNGKGKLRAKPFGGKGPYNVSVSLVGSTIQTSQTVQDLDSVSFDLPPGLYKVTVMDAKYNSNSFTREILPADAIKKPTYSVTHPSCTVPRGLITVVSDGTNFSYELKQNGATKFASLSGYFSDLESGSYEVIAVRGTCRSSDSTLIGVRPAVPNKPQFSVTHPDCNNGKGRVNITNLEANVSYRLNKNSIALYNAADGQFADVDPGQFEIQAVGIFCNSSDSVKVNDKPWNPNRPTKDITQPNCIRARGLIAVTNTDSRVTYNLRQNGVLRAANDLGVFDNVEEGDYELVAVGKVGACTAADSAKINKRPLVPGKPQFTVTHPSCTNAKGRVALSVLEDNVSYRLTQSGLLKFTASNGIFSDVDPGAFQIEAIGQSCSNADTLKVNDKPWNPNKPTKDVLHPSCNRAKGLITITNTDSRASYYLRQSGVDKANNDQGVFDLLDDGDYEIVAIGKVGSCGAGDTVRVNARPAIPGKPQFVVTHPTCSNGKGNIKLNTVEENVAYRLTQNGLQKFTASNGFFSDVDPGSFQIDAVGVSCNNSDSLKVNDKPWNPNRPTFSITHPGCDRAKGLLTVTNTDSRATFHLKQNGVTLAILASGQFDNLDDGLYEVTAASLVSNCSNADSAKINKRPSIPAKPIITITHPNCTNSKGSVVVTSPETGVTYKMFQGTTFRYQADNYGVFTEVDPGDYTFVAAGTYCSSNNPGTVNAQPPTPTAPTLQVTYPDFCNTTGTVVITSPTASNFQYSKDNGANWTMDNTFTGLASGSQAGLKFQVKSDRNCISPATTIPCSPTSTVTVSSANTGNLTASEQVTQSAYLGAGSLEAAAVTVKTIPNPFTNKVRFVIESPKAGQGVLELYNLQGQKVKTLYQGLIREGQNYYDLNLSERRHAEYLYILRMNDSNVNISGKLVQVK